MRALWIALIPFALFAAIGHVEFFKTKYKWSYKAYLLRWVKGIGAAFSNLFVSFAGTPPVKRTTAFDRGDSKYGTITEAQFVEAASWTNGLMKGFGMTLAEYQKLSNDCEDYVWVKAGLMRFYLRDLVSGDGAVPIGVIGYRRDSDGVGHALIQSFVGRNKGNRQRLFMEGFPEYDRVKFLSVAEVDSIFCDFM